MILLFETSHANLTSYLKYMFRMSIHFTVMRFVEGTSQKSYPGISLFLSNVLFPYPMKASENLLFSNVFTGYRNKTFG